MDVIARLDGTGGPGGGVLGLDAGQGGHHPVGHHQALEAPLIPQAVHNQVAALGGVLPVEQVVGGHQGMGLALLDGNLKALEIDVPQGPLADVGVGEHAVGLLVVAAEVLDGGAAARMALHTLGDGSRHLAGDEGVLGVVFKVPAAQGAAVDVQRGGQPQVHPKALHLVAH